MWNIISQTERKGTLTILFYQYFYYLFLRYCCNLLVINNKIVFYFQKYYFFHCFQAFEDALVSRYAVNKAIATWLSRASYKVNIARCA